MKIIYPVRTIKTNISNSPVTFSKFPDDSTEEEATHNISIDDTDTNDQEELPKESETPINNIIISKTVADNIQQNESIRCKQMIFKRILPSALVSIGTGVAMMPIFNHLTKNSKDFGIDIHNNEKIFIASTVNTFIVTSFSSFCNMYTFLKNNKEVLKDNSKNICVSIGKIGASCSLILPLGLLWSIELNNQKVTNSTGFNEYIALATFVTAPLVIDNIIQSIQTFDYFNSDKNIDLNSIGAKIVVYGLTASSLAGRMIAYTEASTALLKALGVSSQIALGLGIVTGGVIGSAGSTFFEYKAIKHLFDQDTTQLTKANVIAGIISAIEGAWLTIPIVSIGLNATEDLNPLLKGALFSSLFISHTVLESSKLYDSMNMCFDTIQECISSTIGQCNDYTDLDVS